jgi:DNA repair exonuclease SbcCD ATPase subunit
MAHVTIDFYELLKKGGNLLQYRLNNRIKNSLNQFSIIDFTSTKTNPLSNKLDQIQNYSEQLSNYINLPTKTDLANATQLILQSEEKIDNLDDQLFELTNMMKEVKQLIEQFSSNPSDDYSSQLTNKISEQEQRISTLQNELAQAKQQLITQKEELSTSTISNQAI